jgi:small subunit ribosomal protein S7
MARRKRVYNKEVHKDSRYDSELVSSLISPRDAETARKPSLNVLSIRAIDILNEKSDSVHPLELFNRAIENAKPRVEVKARRVGGATYQVPLEVSPARQEWRWQCAGSSDMPVAAKVSRCLMRSPMS